MAQMTDLHVACRKRFPLSRVEELIAEYPAAARTADKRGLLPLHWCAERKAAADVVAALVKAFPEGAGVADNAGMLPLHSAAANGASHDCVAALLSANPNAAATADGASSSRLPLHYAAARKAPLEVVELLLAANPAAAAHRDANGKTPADLAIAHGASAAIVSALNDEAPSAPRGIHLPERHWNADLHAWNVREADVPSEAIADAAEIFRNANSRRRTMGSEAGLALLALPPPSVATSFCRPRGLGFRSWNGWMMANGPGWSTCLLAVGRRPSDIRPLFINI